MWIAVLFIQLKCHRVSQEEQSLETFLKQQQVPVIVPPSMSEEVEGAKKQRHPFVRTPKKVRLDLLICLGCVFADYLGDNLLAPSYDSFISEKGPESKSEDQVMMRLFTVFLSDLEFGISTSLITLAYILGRALSGTVLGSMSDFIGRWNIIVFCTFLTSIGFLLQVSVYPSLLN